jgi:hypothetical protein
MSDATDGRAYTNKVLPPPPEAGNYQPPKGEESGRIGILENRMNSVEETMRRILSQLEAKEKAGKKPAAVPTPRQE